MFKCAITGKNSKEAVHPTKANPRGSAAEKPIRLVVETRKKSYFGPLFETREDDDSGKKYPVYQKDNYGNLLRDEEGKPLPVMTKVGEGFEIVREISVTREGYEKYIATQGKENA